MRHPFKRTVCLLLTLVLCAGLLAGLGSTASAMTLEERQQAVIAVAWAYFDKGHSVQYDGETMCDNINRADGGKTRSTNQAPPEYATPNETLYTVCSDYAHQVYWETFHYQLMGSAGACWTGKLVNTKADDPMSVWRFDAGTGPSHDDAITEMLSLAQPGDVFTIHTTNNAGHTMLIAGDIMGDGKLYIIHSGGSRMDLITQKDVREYKSKDDPEYDPRCGGSFGPTTNGGSIRINVADDYIRAHYAKPSIVKMNLLRPLNVLSESEYPVTPATLYRMSHPRLSIDRYLDGKTRFGSGYTGENVTMTITLKNSSDKTYTVPVTEKVPAGAKVVTPFAGTQAGSEMKWNVELKAGESKTFTCTYEITAKFGETVAFEGSSVGDIPSNSLCVKVGGAKLNAEEKAKLADIAAGKYDQALKDAKAKNTTLGDVVYQKILGLNVALPDFKTVTGKLIKETKTPTDKPTHVFLKKEEVPAEYMTAYETLVPACHGGFSIWEPWGWDRCADPRDMHLEPGDVIVRSDNLSAAGVSEQLVYLGDGKYLYYDRSRVKYAIVEEPEFFRCLLYKVFYVLRPTLAYEDVHTLAALPENTENESKTKLKFTDVKESDWFYEYVRDLVADGTVSGMTETTFAPNGTLTYGQALKLITLIAGEKEQEKTGAHWASGYLTLAQKKKWVEGDVDLNGPIMRITFCKIAAKAKNIKAQPAENPFTDTTSEEVLALYRAGVINGMTATEFKPKELLTRAQISKIIWMLRGA